MNPALDSTAYEGRTDLTRALAERAAAWRFEDLSADVRRLAKHCVLDWLGVTLAAAADPLVTMVIAAERPQGGPAGLIGHPLSATAGQAALINGSASHALDYDDVNLAILGHPTVAILPGLIALAQERRLSGAHVMTAFVAGYDTACRVGQTVMPDHYEGGFHATATLGVFGGAAAACRLLDLDGSATVRALGIAATTAAGLKSMFGTMCKPLHAGRAAQAAVLAAQLAEAGFTSNEQAIECAQGFAATHSARFDPAAAWREPASGAFILDTLFKFHAACYLTHSTIEAATALRERHGLALDQIQAVTVTVHPACDKVCNIAEPATGLEAKFSLRLAAAMGLAGRDTAALDSFSDEVATAAALCRLRDRVSVGFSQGRPTTHAEMSVTLQDGRVVSAESDSGLPERDLDAQDRKLNAKFMGLAVPILGAERAQALAAAVDDLDCLPDLNALVALCAPGPRLQGT
ncbi:2-methylcitrate dehydratase PrpD [Rhodoligotrophos appendicifer]|uniref:MmgE/PrpD family protein n=1 Tax=Rhodoligotrophos appendicifer TaxID=987056 RepID=UPI0011867176|nr:MmgE/PrpD family protein [Rhodoligotrophos appendicifer]